MGFENVKNNEKLSYAGLLALLEGLQKKQCQLEKDNADLKRLLALKENQLSDLEKEIEEDGERIDFLFEMLAQKEQERKILEASLNGKASLNNNKHANVANECSFAALSYSI